MKVTGIKRQVASEKRDIIMWQLLTKDNDPKVLI